MELLAETPMASLALLIKDPDVMSICDLQLVFSH